MIKAATLNSRGIPANATPGRSRLLAALRAPWLATSRTNTWLAVAMVVAGTLGAAIIYGWVPDRHAAAMALVAYAGGIGFWWAFCMASLLLLARDARRAGIPGVTRNTLVSVGIYAVLNLGLPVLLMRAVHANVALATLLSGLAMTVAVAYMLLPRFIATLLGFIPAIYLVLHNLHMAPSLLDPRGMKWTAIALVVAAIYDVIRWRQLLVTDALDHRDRSSPMLVFMRLNSVRGGWEAMDRAYLAKPGDNRAQGFDLSQVDDRHPVKAINVALASLVVPRTHQANLLRMARILWVIPLMGIAVLPGLTAKHHFVSSELFGAMALAGVGWLVLFTALMTPFAAIALLRHRWSRGGELALLALLPGLGRHRSTHASVARATLAKPTIIQAVAALLVLAILFAKHVNAASAFLVLLFFSLLALITAWISLRILAGRPMQTWLLVSLAVAGLLLMTGSTPLVIAAATPKAGAIWVTVAWCVDVALLVLCVAFAWLTRRAWRAFCRRPHPFLGNAR